MFYAHLLLSQRGPLSKIWMAAHWEKKLTKAHIFECNLETAIQSIISPKVTIALRTSGHLLLGVVRIYHRKAKYLLADCNEAFIKMKMTFRPGSLDLSDDNQEAIYNAITLPEEFHEFDIQLPDLNVIDVADHFSLNQSRIEDITLREDLILHGGFDQRGLYGLKLMDTCLFQPHQGEFMASTDDDKLLLSDDAVDVSIEVTLPTEEVHLEVDVVGTETDHPGPVASPNPVNSTTLLPNEEDGFILEPVDTTSATMERKRTKRKRRLIVDNEKELASSTMRQQLMDFTDTVIRMDTAPCTSRTMEWKMKGGVEWLLSNPSQPIISTDLLLVFTRCVMMQGPGNVQEDREEPGIETIRHGEEDVTDLPQLEEPTYLQESRLTDISSPRIEEPSRMDQPMENSQEYADLLSPASIPVNDSHNIDERLEAVESSQDSEERRWNQRTQEMLRRLRKLNESGVSSFSLHKLCTNNVRRQASAKFYSFLVLKKQAAIQLRQSAPYCDVIATPGPRFYSL